MVDTTLNNFLSSGTHAERLAFTPSPGAERPSGNDPSYFFLETDTSNAFAWNFDGAAWIQVSTGGLATVTSVGLSLPSIYTVTGSPVTTSGTLTATFAAPLWPPGGRLTLTTGTPVMTANATAQTIVYYDSYLHAYVPVFDGTSVWTYLNIGSDEISMGLDAVTPHVASGSLYDIFGLNNSGTLVIAIGPAWSSTSLRGTGAGTTQLSRQNGIWVNTNALTHAWGGASGTTDYGSVAAKAATYLGTLYATANGQTGMNFRPAGANGGSNPFLALFNAYNREPMSSRSIDTTAAGWTVSSATWAVLNVGGTGSGLNNRCSYIDGLGVIQAAGHIHAGIFTTSTNQGGVGLLLNATTGTPAIGSQIGTSGASFGVATSSATERFLPSLGLNFIQAMQVNYQGTGNVTFTGAVDSTQLQGMHIDVVM